MTLAGAAVGGGAVTKATPGVLVERLAGEQLQYGTEAKHRRYCESNHAQEFSARDFFFHEN